MSVNYEYTKVLSSSHFIQGGLRRVCMCVYGVEWGWGNNSNSLKTHTIDSCAACILYTGVRVGGGRGGRFLMEEREGVSVSVSLCRWVVEWLGVSIGVCGGGGGGLEGVKN